MKDKELDSLLCLIDGKITVYRQKKEDKIFNSFVLIKLRMIQREIQELYSYNNLL